MHRLVIGTVLGLALTGGVASAQTADPGKGYAEVVAQSAFGNVTSQSYGVEGGYTISPTMQLFGEFGYARDVATSTFSDGAQRIATALADAVQPTSVSYSAKQPMTFGVAGVKYLIALDGKIQPYALAGIGIAHVRSNAQFLVGGTDVTTINGQNLVVIGSDLQGSVTRAMISLGAGATYPIHQQIFLDVQFRYGHVFVSDAPVNVMRAGAGIGIKF